MHDISGRPIEITEPLAYRRTSRLLVVRGELDEHAPSITRHFLFDGRRFVLLTRAAGRVASPGSPC